VVSPAARCAVILLLPNPFDSPLDIESTGNPDAFQAVRVASVGRIPDWTSDRPFRDHCALPEPRPSPGSNFQVV
jgi:hypothetical protein